MELCQSLELISWSATFCLCIKESVKRVCEAARRADKGRCSVGSEDKAQGEARRHYRDALYPCDGGSKKMCHASSPRRRRAENTRRRGHLSLKRVDGRNKRLADNLRDYYPGNMES